MAYSVDVRLLYILLAYMLIAHMFLHHTRFLLPCVDVRLTL